MARLLLFLMKCILGLLATLGLFLVLALVGGWLFWEEVKEWQGAGPEELPERILLQLDLAEGLRDGPAEGLFALAGLDTAPSIRMVTEVLERASGDERVAGVILRLGYGDLTPAQVQEMAAALKRFRESGRFALGFAESFGEAGNGNEHYHLATALDEIWLQPTGDLDLIGYHLEQPFVRRLLDDWDIRLRADQRQQWKGLADAALREDLSPFVRENLQAIVDSLYEQLARAIAQGRGLSLEEARRLIDAGPYSARDALDAGLVDRLDYRAAFEKAALERAGEEAALVSLLDYRKGGREEPGESDGSMIALLHLQGAIQLGGGERWNSPTPGVEGLVKKLREAAEDEAVAAIVVRIDSPGGSAVASDMVWHEIKRIREEVKPIVISLGSVAASGGYYIAVAGRPLLAQPGSLTGSIGVAGGKPVLEDFWPRLGLTWDGVQAGDNADIWSLNRDFSPEQWRKFQIFLDRIYEDFTARVAEGRALEGEALESVVGGRIFTGEQALEAGLIDALGGLREAAAAAREAAGLDPDDETVPLADYPPDEEGFLRLLELILDGNVGSQEAILHRLELLLRRVGPLLQALEGLAADPRRDTLRAPALQGS